MTQPVVVAVERVTPAHEGWEQHRARYLRAASRIVPGARVLDAGCGIGYGSAILAEAGADVTGVDASAEALELARDDYAGATFIEADVLALPFTDASFDAITCLEVIEHLERPDALVRELARVLRPCGTLFVSTPNARMERLHARSIGYADNPYHVSPLLPATLRRLLLRAGLRPVLYGQTRDRGRLHALLQSLDPLGLRLRVPPERRAAVEGALAPSGPSATPSFRFSRLLARTAPIVFAEARKT